MISHYRLKSFYGLSTAFVLLNVFFIYKEFYWFNAVPLALAVIVIALLSVDKILLMVAFFTPLSINLEELKLGFGLFVPTEPLLFGILLIFFLKLIYEGKYDLKIAKHPVSLAFYGYLIWLLISATTSQLPLVSFKFLLTKLWFIVSIFFIGVLVFRKLKNIYAFLWLHMIGLTLVIIYTVLHHATFGFAQDPAHYVMQPFYKDHTSYGALIAMFFPFLIGTMFSKKISFNTKVLISFLILVFTIGLVLSYTRAAWVSLAAAVGLLLILKWKVQFKTLALIGVGGLFLLFSFQEVISQKMSKNKQDSSDDLTEHVQSISNVASDASNLERLNRWSCALRLFQDKPIFGWGPGTYQFFYAPYQHSSQLTIISTNFGEKGNAHSEYLGPLAETGLIGALSFIVLIGVILYTGIRLFHCVHDDELKILVVTTLMGFFTYVIHAFLNNFLDTDKAAVGFWGIAAIFVAIQTYHNKSEKLTTK